MKNKQTQITETRPLRGHLARGLADALSEGLGVEGQRDTAPALADALLLDAMRTDATDIHFEPQTQGLLVRLRVDGQLYDAIMVSAADGQKIIRHFKAISRLDASQHFVPTGARVTRNIDGRTVDLRLSVTPFALDEAMTIRMLDRSRVEKRLEHLGLTRRHHREVNRWIEHAFGMFLVAGPSGSGKTTTLYALMHELRAQDRAIFTIEDPIEYELDGVVQTQVDTHHDLTLARGLRSMLRLDPDYLLLGEIRQPEDARAALEASSCGRMLLSTVHAADAVGVVTTLRNLGISDSEIAGSLRVVVAQRLVRRLCPHCKRTVNSVRDSHGKDLFRSLKQTSVPVGCDRCRNVGYSGRIGLFELWNLTDEDRDMILAHASEYA